MDQRKSKDVGVRRGNKRAATMKLCAERIWIEREMSELSGENRKVLFLSKGAKKMTQET